MLVAYEGKACCSSLTSLIWGSSEVETVDPVLNLCDFAHFSVNTSDQKHFLRQTGARKCVTNLDICMDHPGTIDGRKGHIFLCISGVYLHLCNLEFFRLFLTVFFIKPKEKS